MTITSKMISRIYKNDETAFEISLKILTVMMLLAGGVVTGLHYYIHYLTDIEKSDERVRLLSTEKGREYLRAKDEKMEKERNRVKLQKRIEIDSRNNNKKNSTNNTNSNSNKNDSNNGNKNDSKESNIEIKHSKPSFYESLKVLSNDQYLINIAIMVLAYGLTMEFTEIIWKSSVKNLFPIKSDYLKFNGEYSTYIGGCMGDVYVFVCTCVCMFVDACICACMYL